MILKELFNLGFKEDTFGDIIIDDNIAYIYIFSEIFTDIKYNFNLNKISIKEIELIDKDYLSDYQVKYEELELLVSSLRIDNVISSITNDSRKSILERFKNKEIILNYDVVNKYSINLSPNDVFSIRKYGKYKYNGIIKNTKKDGYIISVSKYK
jgi:RNA-binding protein YlmH